MKAGETLNRGFTTLQINVTIVVVFKYLTKCIVSNLLELKWLNLKHTLKIRNFTKMFKDIQVTYPG